MYYLKDNGNFWHIYDTDVKEIITSPFHKFIIRLKDGNRIYTTQIKA